MSSVEALVSGIKIVHKMSFFKLSNSFQKFLLVSSSSHVEVLPVVHMFFNSITIGDSLFEV